MSLKVDRELIFILFVVILYSYMGDDELDEVDLDLFIFIESSWICLFLFEFNDETSIEGFWAGSERLEDSHFVSDVLQFVTKFKLPKQFLAVFFSDIDLVVSRVFNDDKAIFWL